MPQDFEDSAYARASLHRALHARKMRRRWQQLVGILLLLAGYMSLAVSADSATEWLLLRVVGVAAIGVIPLLVVRNGSDDNSELVPILGSLALVLIWWRDHAAVLRLPSRRAAA